MKVKISVDGLSLVQLARYIGTAAPVLHGMETAPRVKYICTDSREAGPDTMLVAIRGERVDGHKFLGTAAAAGCTAFLVDRIPDSLRLTDTSWAALVADDTVAALSPMSAGYRRDYLSHLFMVGVTGSVGKTTVKELISCVLSEGFPTYRREGNNNSVIGLPLSVTEIDPSFRAAVLEMGMSARGEISAMARAVSPDIAVITNIGSSHLEHLGTRENIARAKLEMLDGIRQGGQLIVPADEPLIDRFLSESVRTDVKVWRVSLTDTDADAYVYATVPDSAGSHFSLRMTQDGQTENLENLYVPAPGAHMVYNAALAVLVGVLAGVTLEAVRTGLAAYRPAALRQSVTAVGGMTVLEDCYNAAPESMRAALNVLDTVARRTADSPARRIAVLGDMRELGTDTVSLHRGVGADCAARHLDRLITVGALGAQIAWGALDAGMPGELVTALYTDGAVDADNLTEFLSGLLCPGDAVLFKASRALALERVSQAVKQKAEANN